jgi:hypothetical protein
MAGGRFTSEAAVIRFLEAAENPGEAGPSIKTANVRRQVQIAGAQQRLAAAGI